MTTPTIDVPRALVAPGLRGRDTEVAAIAEHIRDAKHGRGSVLIIEGDAGVGKSRLLDEAMTFADVEGFSVGGASAVRGDDELSMVPLLAALFDGPAPVLESSPAAVTSHRDWRYWLVHRLAVPLERTSRRAPVLVCIDDAQWADRGTSAALRILCQRLTELPVVWVIALRPNVAAPAVADVTALLKRRGAATLALAPLGEEATTQLITDVVRAEPTAELLDLAAQAGGDPSLLVELVRGLVEEGLVQVDSGRAALCEARIPRRVCELIRSRLAYVSGSARDAAVVAAILGTTASFGHLAGMLDVLPASLLGPIDELVRADVLVDRGGTLTFRNELIRHAVTEVVSPSVCRALRLQAIDALLDAGVSPREPAIDLAASIQSGDRAAASTLVAASRAVGSTNPDVAAELSRRAFELTAAGDDARAPLVADFAALLHAAGRAEEAKAAVDAVLRERLTSEDEASVRLSVARMWDISPEVRVDAGRIALALSGVSSSQRAQHASELVANEIDSGREDIAAVLLPRAMDAAASSGDPSATHVLDVARARLAAVRGDLQTAREQLDVAVAADGREMEVSVRRAALFRAELHLAADDFDGAHQAASAGLAIARRDGQVALAREWQRFLGRYLLQTGNLAGAAEAFGGELEAEAAHSILNPSHAVVPVALGCIATHTGDDRQARMSASLARSGLSHGGPAVRRHAAWVLALQTMAAGDAVAARAFLTELGDRAEIALLPTITMDAEATPALVRIALATGDDELAHAVMSTAADLERRNPRVDSIAAAAAQARGLVRRDPAALRDAVELLAGGPRVLFRASAFEDLGVELARRGTHDAAIEALDQSLQLYARCGATWDASRVRRRLRELGVRRRLDTPARETTGWPSLTEGEVAVVRLVANALTNRAVATRLFLSPHTVSMHLRHVYLKLGINSRVELTRIALAHDNAAALGLR